MKNMKRLIVAILAVLCTLGLSAQEFTGGVKGRVVSRADRSSLEGAVLTLYQGGEAIAETNDPLELLLELIVHLAAALGLTALLRRKNEKRNIFEPLLQISPILYVLIAATLSCMTAA